MIQPAPTLHVCSDALTVEDQVIEVVDFPGVVTLGHGSVGFIHPGVVVDVTPGAIAYLAPGAHLHNERPGALERGEISIIDWDPSAP